MESNESNATMTNKSYFMWAFVPFLIITIIYFKWQYVGKLSYQKSVLDPAEKSNYTFHNYLRTLFYFFIVFIVQICIGWSVVSASGCNIVKDKGRVIGEVFKSTAFPWLFIFGFSLIIVLLKSNIKSVFSNVYGYSWVSARSNSLLTELLKNEAEVKALRPFATGTDPNIIQNSADAILKICGNTGILINQITPDNFVEYMKMLQPLMKENDPIKKYSEAVSKNFEYNKLNFNDPNNIFNKLFTEVETRDNIGEMSWYIYTGLFVIAIVSYNIAMIPCR
jgi:hypothetical protein